MSQPEATDHRSEKDIFFEVLEKTTPEERLACLDRACGKDSPLRRRVEALLANHLQDDSFMREPAVEAASPTKVVPPPLSEVPGTIIGRYKLLEKVGEGGFGAVYVAEQREPVKRRVALKVIKLGMDTNQVVARFEAERQALAMMDHPNIARVLDAGATEAGRPYFVMELVRGVPMTEYCDQNSLPTAERLDLFIAVCHAIQHAHQKGIIHRDIKPSNILVTLHDGVAVPKVIDFGIAKATRGALTDKTIYTQFHQFIGTPAYISPEQAEISGLDVDTRSDIYSLGALLYELLVGRTPFDGRELLMSGLDELRRLIREKEPLRPSTRLSAFSFEEMTTTAKRRGADTPRLIHALQGDLDWIVMKCLEKDRTRRYATAGDLAADLHRHLSNEPVIARPPSKRYRLQKLVRRHQGTVVALSAVALALVLGLGIATMAFLSEREARLSQAAAEEAKLAETVRADAVGEFMGMLLKTTAPELLLQGHQRPVRDLLKAADQLASTILSNAPVAEFELRDLMAVLYLGEGPSLLDSAASYDQIRRMKELLGRLPDHMLPRPRDEYRIRAAGAELWGRDAERGLAGLQALKDEFRRRTPPADHYVAWCLAAEGNWLVWKGEAAAAESNLREALSLAPAGTSPAIMYFIRGYLALALSDRGAAVEAEKVARDGLLPPAAVRPDMAPAHVGLLSVLAGALCQEKRFDEARSLLREQKRELSARGCPPREVLMLEKKLGEVLARSGNATEALDLLLAVAMDPLSTARDCGEAACIAIGAGDVERYGRLCAVALARFAAGAEGINALALSEMLLAAPHDDVVTHVAADLVQRVEQARDLSAAWVVGLREWLQFRRGHPAEAARLWPLPASLPPPTELILARVRKSDHLASVIAFRSALALVVMGRSDEALRAYVDGLKSLGPRPSGQHARDLGEGYARWYLAEAHRREAEELLKAKDIAVPEVSK